VACRRAAEGKSGLSRTYIGFRNLRLVLLAQLTALRDEQLTLRDDCSLLLFNIPLDPPPQPAPPFFFLFFGGLSSVVFKTFIIVFLSACCKPSLCRVHPSVALCFVFRRPHRTARFRSSLQYQVAVCANRWRQYMHTHAPCGYWLDLGSFYFASEGRRRLVYTMVYFCGSDPSMVPVE